MSGMRSKMDSLLLMLLTTTRTKAGSHALAHANTGVEGGHSTSMTVEATVERTNR